MSDAPFLRESPNALPLADWIGQVAKLAGYDNGAELVAETGACCWMDYYTEGLTPEETWAAECSNG